MGKQGWVTGVFMTGNIWRWTHTWKNTMCRWMQTSGGCFPRPRGADDGLQTTRNRVCAWNRFSLRDLRRKQPCWLWIRSWIRAPRTVRWCISVIWSTQCVALCYGRPSKLERSGSPFFSVLRMCVCAAVQVVLSSGRTELVCFTDLWNELLWDELIQQYLSNHSQNLFE